MDSEAEKRGPSYVQTLHDVLDTSGLGGCCHKGWKNIQACDSETLGPILGSKSRFTAEDGQFILAKEAVVGCMQHLH